jgi:hypothetical protein
MRRLCGGGLTVPRNSVGIRESAAAESMKAAASHSQAIVDMIVETSLLAE